MTARVQQTRTGRLADDFFLMVHDEGRARLAERIQGLGLAAAVLGELAFLGAVAVAGGYLRPVGGELQAADPLANGVLSEVRGERPLPVRDWLDYLSQNAAERVGRRLVAAGVMDRRPPLLPLPGLAGRWAPKDPSTAVWPAVDVGLKVHNGTLDLHHLALFGLISATGLNHPSLYAVRDRLHDPAALTRTLAPLAEMPPLLDLLAALQTAVASAVTSRRHS